MATCPECDAEISVHDDDVEEMEVGDPWDCDACGSRLRVAILDPLEFETDDEDEDEEDEDEPAAVGADGETEELDEDDDDDGEVDEDGEGGDWDE
jgi:DNA-directed RNA polymerase subunit RPC12/RpoP